MSLAVRVGPALVLGDHVNTDELHPSKFYSLRDEGVRSGFLGAVPGRALGQEVRGSIVVAGQNFGAGSSRETGARVFLLAGIQAVVAASMARIFQRNLLNLGMCVVTCPGITGVQEGDLVTVDIEKGQVRVGEESWPIVGLDPYHRELLAKGGLLPWLGLPP